MTTLKFRGRWTIPLVSLALLAGFHAKGHAQCTRSCGAPPPSSSPLITLYSFAGQPDGANPRGDLVLDPSGNLYGTTLNGGTSNQGTAFKLDTTGKETVLHSFAGSPDGAFPLAGLIRDAAGNLYGTTANGGPTGTGTVFKLDTGSTETVLYSFTNLHPDGANPFADLFADAAGNFFGTTTKGGVSNNGAVFKLDPAGTETLLYSFTGPPDGAAPKRVLIQDAAGNLYGTASGGGLGPCFTIANEPPTPPTKVFCGTVFAIDAAGNETVLYKFTGQPDGAVPLSGLIRDASGNLFGTTYQGGTGHCEESGTNPVALPTVTGCGTIFMLDTAGEETVLYSFAGEPDGALPLAGLVRDAAGNFYGTTFIGGASGAGTVFKLDTMGAETVLYSFTGGPDGGHPEAGLQVDTAGNLYGTTNDGGAAGVGTVFELTPTSAKSFNLAVSLMGNGSGTVTSQPAGINCGATCSASFSSGTVITLTANAASGSNFIGWSGPCSGTAICTVVLNAAESVTATFSALDFTLSVSPTTLNLTPGQSGTATLSITPVDGSKFTINLSCGNVPANVTCGVSPASVPLDGTDVVATTVKVGVMMNAMMPAVQVPAAPWALFASAILALFIFLSPNVWRNQHPRRALLAVSILTLAFGLGSCGGGGSSTTSVQPGSFPITLTGSTASPALSHSTTLTLNVTM
jgi:uncharacterized repeat protein (TIGR03803 family)